MSRFSPIPALTDPILQRLVAATSGHYRIQRELGRGGMGAVYLADDLVLERAVAIKVLPPELAMQAALRERFVREARLAASLSHPNIIHVHAVIEEADLLAIVMQYVDGETLQQRVERSGPYDPSDVARLLQDTAWALGYAHARGIVHRDVKPDNLMIERGTGRSLIMDFGIARKERVSGLTEAGHSIGTPMYMSPEQAAAEDVDGRSDLYSLGCVAFFAATGRPPFVGDSAHKLLMQHLTTAAPDVASVRPGFPPGLAAVIGRSLEKEPGRRFDSGEAMADEVEALQLRSREVAPLLRLFYQQSSQAPQALAVLTAMFLVFWNFSGERGTLLGTIVAILFLSSGATIITQALDRVRFVVRAGFTEQDVQAAFEAIREETQRARQQLIGDPIEYQRIKRRKRISMLGGFLGGVALPVIPRFVFVEQGGRTLYKPVGGLLLLVVSVLVGLSVALWAMRPVRVTLGQRLAQRMWKSRLGIGIFARARRRYARELARATKTS